MSSLRVRGRELSAEDLDIIRAIASQAGQTRKSISIEVCERLDWRQTNGRLWDMACRYLLLRLEKQGLLVLPPPKPCIIRKRHPPRFSKASEPQMLISKPVTELGPLQWHQVDGTKLAHLWNELISRYHYLGCGAVVGPHIRYLIGGDDGWLAALCFSGAAWKLRPRDEWIGWTKEQRQQRLRFLVNQSRFLLLPWVQSKNLASHILGLAARRLVLDWEHKYSYRPLLLETFVDTVRFRGICYRAANWVHLGQTQGRGKMDQDHQAPLPIKDIFVYPLDRRARDRLCAP